MNKPTYSTLVRGKWTYDGSETLDDMIAALQSQLAHLEAMKQAGLKLQHKVEDDYAFIVTDDAEAAAKFGLQLDEDDEDLDAEDETEGEDVVADGEDAADGELEAE